MLDACQYLTHFGKNIKGEGIFISIKHQFKGNKTYFDG
jgi:hypothetical protein